MDWCASATRMKSVEPKTTTEDAEVEEQRAGEVDLAEQRHLNSKTCDVSSG